MSMMRWRELLLEPESLDQETGYPAWFDAIARRLLCGCRLVAGGTAYRLTEIEVYYHGGTHLDPFSHRDPIQIGTGLWYFHRTHGVHRGGSFKGLDLTFAGPDAFGGALIRGIESQDGVLIDGPSLCVDHLLARTGKPTVAQLDEAVAVQPAWKANNPLYLKWLPELANHEILKTARVGLSLKRLRPSAIPVRYLLRRYRYLSEPRRIAKGKPHMVLALYAEGFSPAEIRERTGCTRQAIERWIGAYQEGSKESDFAPYFGIDLGPIELARLHGLWGRKELNHRDTETQRGQ